MTVATTAAAGMTPPGSMPDARREGRALGSSLRLTVEPGVTASAVDRAWAAVEDAFAAVDVAMSRFREDSEITQLHRAGQPVANVSGVLVAALTAADRAARITGGRFDARVVTHLERLGFAAVPQALAFDPRPATARFMRREGRNGPIELLAPVDLGGIGKGLALRWAARRAASHLGTAGFLIDAGGDLVSRGFRAGEPWSIGIEDPAGNATPVAVVVLDRDQSIATSSVRIGRRTGPDGRTVHHLIDPRTGEPGGGGLQAVSVALPDPAWAEVWSKALFIEGLESIADAARRRGLSAWWIDADGVLSMTPAARQQTSWVRAEARRP